MEENNLITQEWLDAHPEWALNVGDPIPADMATAAGAATDAVTPTEASVVAPDLDAERDARVIPVAQGVLEDIAGLNAVSDVKDKSEFTNVVIKVLKRSLEADLNVSTDNAYVFQLALGAFGAFNKFAMSCKMAEPEDVRYSKIAHDLMTLFANANVPMGMGVKTPDQITALEVIRPQIEEIFARESLTNLEVSFILEGLLNALKVTHQVFTDNVQQAVERMEAKILQVDYISDLSMKKLDDTLKTSIEEILAKGDAEVVK